MKNLQYAKSDALIMEFNKKGLLVFQNEPIPAQLSQFFHMCHFTTIPTSRSYNIILSNNKDFFHNIKEYLNNFEQTKQPILTIRDTYQDFTFDIIAKKNEKSLKLTRFTLIVYLSARSDFPTYLYIQNHLLKIIRFKNNNNQSMDIIDELDYGSLSSKGLKTIVKKKLRAILSFKIRNDAKSIDFFNNFQVFNQPYYFKS